jgi:lipopolysaccharide export system protein LptA
MKTPVVQHEALRGESGTSPREGLTGDLSSRIPHEAPSWLRVHRLAGAVGALLLLVFLSAPSPAQITIQGKLKNFRFPDYYPAAPGQTNPPLKTLLSGVEARQLAGGQMHINGLAIQSYREDGQHELEVKASECVFDIATRQASGEGHLEVTSPSGLYSIEGDGFLWRQADGLLVISNHVQSILHRGLLASHSAGVDSLPTRFVATNSPATGEVVRITSDRCMFNSQSNQAVQSGHVVVDDPQMRLLCENLKVQFTAAKKLQEIVAEQDVSILNKADQSRVTAGRAVYEVSQEKETVTLTENPVWQDRQVRQEARATMFTFDRQERIIRGIGGARMKLPRGSFSQPSLLSQPASAAAHALGRSSDTNEITISSETITLLLAATNRPSRSATAETGVVILSPADDTRASGDKAVYREDTGLINLIGQAQWAAEGRLIKADVLSMDRTNRIFSGRGRTSFRLPLQQAGQAGLFRGTTNRPPATNLFLEIKSDEFIYRTNVLTFQGDQVRTWVYEADALRGFIICGFLSAHFSDRLDSVRAEKHVIAENYPPPKGDGKTVTNLLSCETLTARMSDSNQVITLVAVENVQAAQLEVQAVPSKTAISELTCARLTAVVLPKAGRVDRLEAERQVVISQGDKLARGEKAVYTDKENQVVLSGHPYAEFADGKVTGAETLTWHRATGAFQGQGRYHLEWVRPSRGTNTFKYPSFLPSKK